MDPADLARYPFLEGVSSYLKEREVGLEDILLSDRFENARMLGFRRVMSSFSSEEPALTLPPRDKETMRIDDEMVLDVLLSYIVARMLVSVSGDQYVIRRFVTSESKRMSVFMGHEDLEGVLGIAGELDINVTKRVRRPEKRKDIHIQLAGGGDVPEELLDEVVEEFGDEEEPPEEEIELSIHFTDYLRNTAGILGGTGGEWKLINRTVDGGQVILTRRELVRVLQVVIGERIGKDLPAPTTKQMKKAFRRYLSDITNKVGDLKAKTRSEATGEVRSSALPPCMKVLLRDLQEGVNIPHHGRFAITSFLNSLGIDEKGIIAIFSSAPDFDISKARYQIEHIMGTSGGTVYTPPKCDTMKTYGICVSPDLLCQNIRHPMNYYWTRLRSNKLDLAWDLHMRSQRRNAVPITDIIPKVEAVRKGKPKQIEDIENIGFGEEPALIRFEADLKGIDISGYKYPERYVLYAKPYIPSLRRGIIVLPITGFDLILRAHSLSRKKKPVQIDAVVFTKDGRDHLWAVNASEKA